jgi:predicted permease
MKFALRSLAKSPGFALVSILTVALGIGSVTAIYSVANAVIFRPLPFHDEQSLAWIWSTRPDRDRAFFSIPHFLDLRRANTTTADLAAITPQGMNVSGLGEPERVPGWRVSPNLFELLGTQAHLGRMPRASDDFPGAAPIAVLGYNYWQRRLGGEAAMIGRTLTLNGTPHTIVGILPPAFFLPTWETEIVAVQSIETDARREDRGTNFLRAIARLKPGVTFRQAQSEFAALTQTLAQRFPDTDAAITAPRFVPLRDEAAGGYGSSLLLLLGAAGMLLLIMCTNLGGLLAARALVRRRDAALCLALGASPARLFRSYLGEGFAIAAIGGALGIAACALGLQALLALAPADLPRAAFVNIDGAVLLVALGCVVATGLGVGIVPALRLARTPPQDVLKSSSQATTGRSRARTMLVGTQIALCTVLLIATGLFVRSLQKILEIQPGFISRGVLTAQVSLPSTNRGVKDVVGFAEQFARRLGEQPGVRSASLTHVLPLSGINTRSEFTRADRPPAKPSETLSAANRFILENFFQTMGIPLRGGRDFLPSDDEKGRPVVIIDQALADRFWPGEDPLGKVIRVPDGREKRDLEIIGIVGATKHFSLEEPATPALYLPVRQITPTLLSFFVGRMIFVARIDGGDPLALREPVRRTLRSIDADAAVSLRSFDEAIAWAKAPRIFSLRLLGFFSAVAVLLAAIGLYAITSQAVTMRTREIGIRMALGADRSRITREVLAGGARVVFAGVATGLAGAAALVPLIGNMLYGVRAFDPWTFTVIGGLLSAIGIAATWLPARRATKVDPIIALRSE